MNEIHHPLSHGNKHNLGGAIAYQNTVPLNSAKAVNEESLDLILLDCRFAIATAFHTGGPSSALAAVAAGSIQLSRHVVAGSLIWKTAFKTLLEVSVNLGLVNRFGRRALRAAFYAGPSFYSELSEAA